ncbi:MAG TPA: PIG-L family deacetylase [Gemmatimonadales bacterium]|jgi:LmbE family N-acetylglucosaminyl deacetylase
MRRIAVASFLITCAASTAVAQQLTPPSTGGIVAIDRMLGHLATNKRVLVIGAHPDDENNEFMTLISRGMGVDAAYFSLSRGEGGQNLIGSQLGEALGLIRTGELLAARAVDGGHQYFSRDFDYGFSKSLAEADEFWPRDTSLEDLVRVIRRFRPQVIMSVFSGTPRDGHGQHQQAGTVATEAFELLRDSAWGPKKLYRSNFFDTTHTTLRIPSGIIDPSEGKSYLQLAAQSRSQHRSQDMGAIQRLGPSMVRLSLIESTVDSRRSTASDSSLFQGVDTSLVPGLQRYAALIDSARAALGPRGMTRVSDLLLRALGELRRHAPPQFKAQQEPILSNALLAASDVVLDPWADDGTIVPGQSVNVTLSVWSAGSAATRVSQAEIDVPAGWTVTAPTGGAAVVAPQPGTVVGSAPARAGGMDTRRFVISAAADAPLSEPYFLVRPRIGAQYDWSQAPDSLRGEPLDPPLVTALVTVDIAGTPVTVRREVSFRFADQASGEVRKPIFVVPAVGVSVSPDLLVVPVQAPEPRSVTVQLVHGARGVTNGELQLDLPAGWPAVAPQRFTLEGEGTRRSVIFQVRPPASVTPGSYEIHAVAVVGGQRFDRGTVIIEYPHIRPMQYSTSATVKVQAASLALPTLHHVGYVRGAADMVPEALQSIGIPLTVLTPEDLERADLSQYDVIVIGSRAYEVAPALIANNARLLDYARAGGRVIVQYQQYQFINGNFAPFPLTIAQPHDRVTDENAPVTILQPGNSLFQTPNQIGEADWSGWIQERGLYFAHSWDPAYKPMLEMGDAPLSEVTRTENGRELASRGGGSTADGTASVVASGPRDRLEGGLLVAHLGRGLYVYTGLAFFRELPAGVPGAYRLFVNLLGLEPNSVP